MSHAIDFTPFLPERINTGPWVAGYSLDVLRTRIATTNAVLPICSLGTPAEELGSLGDFVLPPLYHEAFAEDPDLKPALIARIRACFPFFEGTAARAQWSGKVEVIELPPRPAPRPAASPTVLGIGVDTTVEQHGPHLPLGTDTIQTYGVLRALAKDEAGFAVGPALEYGQLTWGLPFGMSVDLTPPLLTRYAHGFANALIDWGAPAAIFVADVHGSVVHQESIAEGFRRSRCSRWKLRWLPDSLLEFSAERGDMHAGGVETTLVAQINPALVDGSWWPARMDELARGEMTVAETVALSADMPRFIARVERDRPNGIIGSIRNGLTLDAGSMLRRMVAVAREDVRELRGRS